jgi:rhodanese-related sulfurtransferase
MYGEPWSHLIAPTDLTALLDKESATVIDLDTSLIYRDGHIQGAHWAVRSRLQTQIDGLPASQTIAVTSGDGQLAALAAGEIAALRPDSAVLVLIGGTENWKSQGLPLETGLTHPLGPNDDVQYKPYDREGGVEAAMQDYLQWEVALVEQIARDGTLTFRRFD